MGYWKSKVLPKIMKVFEKNGAKKAAAAEATKSFDESKETINKEFEEKKAELQPKVLEIYEATSAEVKTLVKEPKEDGLKKHSAAVQKFLDELVKIEFPGSKAVAEASSKLGVVYLSGPVGFIFEKVSTFIPEEKTKELPEEGKTEETAAVTAEEASGAKEKEIVIEEEKKEEAKPEEKKEEVKAEEKEDPAEPAAAPAEAPAKTEEKKEDAPAEPPKP